MLSAIFRRDFKQNIKFIGKLGLNLTYCVHFQEKEMTGFLPQCVTKACTSKVFTFHSFAKFAPFDVCMTY